MSADTAREVPARVRAAAHLAELVATPANVRRLPSAAPAPVPQPPRRGRHGKGVMPLQALREQRRQAATRSAITTWLDLVRPAPALGLDAQEAAMVEAAKAVLARRLSDRAGLALNTAQAVRELAYLHLASLDHERFAVAFLDSRLRLIAFEEMFTGSLTQTAVYPREVARHALARNAASVILVHNHPSGELAPSLADMQLTVTLKQALALIDVQVIDHVIVGGAGSMSFAEQGLI